MERCGCQDFLTTKIVYVILSTTLQASNLMIAQITFSNITIYYLLNQSIDEIILYGEATAKFSEF